jgi:ADP-heptose:LPS heptosyltransferase
MGRTATRLRILPRALWQRCARRRRRPEGPPGRVLIAHHLLLGDTLMLSALIAKLRSLWPACEIAMTVDPAFAGCYAGQPYGVRALPFDPRDPAGLGAIFALGPFDLALVPGDNRYSWLALAAGARWIVAFAADRPAWKNWPVDELRPYPAEPAAWGDMAAGLVDGPAPPAYRPEDWPVPPAAAFERPARAAYAVLHVGASSPLKCWEPSRWRTLAEALEARGLQPVFLAGRQEQALVGAIDPQGHYMSYAGRLDLAQVWQLLRAARLLVAPDTGIAHLGRLVGVPTVALFGPGSALLCGAGAFWRDSPYHAVTVEHFPCRDQPLLFRRTIAWVQRCGRSTRQCASPRCMQAIGMEPVLAAVQALLGRMSPDE